MKHQREIEMGSFVPEKKEFGAELGLASAEARTATFVFSNASVDRYGDTVNVRGWQIGNYMQNPVILDSHDASSVKCILARTIDISLTDNALVGTIEFVPEGTSETADLAWKLVSLGFLKTVSVGFRPIEYRPSSDKSRKGGVDFIAQELLEVSLVPVPALPSALIQAKAAGLDIQRLRSFGLMEKKVSVFKGLYQVSWLAMLVEELGWLQESAEIESAAEGDESPVPAQLFEALQKLGATLIAMTQEEVAELLAEEAAPDDDSGESDYLTLAAPESVLKNALHFAKFVKSNGGKQVAVSLSPEAKAGRVLSSANAAALNNAHATILEGCGKLKGLLDSLCSAEAEDDSSDAGESGEDEAKSLAALSLRQKRVRELRAVSAKLKLCA